MDTFSKRYGGWALVAGAAEGIGASFCETLARKKMNLLMVDIMEQSLKETADRMETSYHIKTVRQVLDLSEKDAWKNCMNLIGSIDCRLLIYIPAFSPVKSFLSNSPAELEKYLRLNSFTPLHLVHAFAGHTRIAGSGGIVLMSSLAGLIGPKFVAPYAATKAFNIVLAESLFYELRSQGIAITACCAGPTSTPTFWASLPEAQETAPDVMDPAKVAECAMKNLGRKAICIPGWKNRLFYFVLLHILPRKIAGCFVSQAIGRMYSSIK